MLPEALAPRAQAGSGTGTQRRAVGAIVGIDAGGTKTAAMSRMPNGDTQTTRTGPGNPDAVGREVAIGNVAAALGAVAAGKRVEACVVGVAGLWTEDMLRDLTEMLLRDVSIPLQRLFLVNDTVPAWAAATGGAHGLVGILGTGSNAFGVGGLGRSWRAGGWGHMLGDEASGWWFGRQAVRWAVAFRDGRSSRPPFLDELLREVAGKPSVESLAQRAQQANKATVAAWAKYPLGAAERGDEECLHLLQDGVREFLPQLIAVSERVNPDRDIFPYSVLGGLAGAYEVIVREVRRQVAEVHEHLLYREPVASPVEGALLLAGRAASLEEYA